MALNVCHSEPRLTFSLKDQAYFLTLYTVFYQHELSGCQWQFNFDPFKDPVGNLKLTPLTTLQILLVQCLFYAYLLNGSFHH